MLRPCCGDVLQQEVVSALTVSAVVRRLHGQEFDSSRRCYFRKYVKIFVFHTNIVWIGKEDNRLLWY